ncbi:centaurin-gamma-1A-like [Dermacentor silvarum]|uniref:centaurin-gamma-1A-like n=1 Tax=Dermacentor silvarum TaxID=543639 RepID=UPI002101C025|nr:centaurin-gamma-1A-like [Dermacentor silvarum]
MNNRTQPYYNNSLAIRQEIQRFESVHPSIYAIYDLLEVIPDPLLAQQIREHVVCIEGKAPLLLGILASTRGTVHGIV